MKTLDGLIHRGTEYKAKEWGTTKSLTTAKINPHHEGALVLQVKFSEDNSGTWLTVTMDPDESEAFLRAMMEVAAYGGIT